MPIGGNASIAHLYGIIRRQLIPFPRMSPLNPSSVHIRTRLAHTPRYCWAPPVCGCTCLTNHNQPSFSSACARRGRDAHWMILSRSSGLTTVREAAPATPPATK